jgi:glyoxylase-like metal-dependent hydrolase (beta-lactamase superfamily II)
VRPDGEARFPNATHHVHPADWSFFALVDDPEDVSAREGMSILEEAGMLDLSSEDREIVPGVHVLHAPGHTPGHRCVLVADGPFTMLLAGDLLHLPFQAAHPEWDSSHDEDPERGAVTRSRLLARAREERWAVAVSHFARPFGGVVLRGGVQRWASA